MRFVSNNSNLPLILPLLEQILQVKGMHVEVMVARTTPPLTLEHPFPARKIIVVGGVDVAMHLLPPQVFQSARYAIRQVIQPLNAIIGMITLTP